MPGASGAQSRGQGAGRALAGSESPGAGGLHRRLTNARSSGQRRIVKRFERDLPSATACSLDDFEACIGHLRLPIARRRVIRTTNLLERLVGEERRRTKVIPARVRRASGAQTDVRRADSCESDVATGRDQRIRGEVDRRTTQRTRQRVQRTNDCLKSTTRVPRTNLQQARELTILMGRRRHGPTVCCVNRDT